MTVRPSTFTELPTTLSQAFNSALTAQLQTTQYIQHAFSAIAAEQRARFEALETRSSSFSADTHVHANACPRRGQMLEKLRAKLKGHQPHHPTITWVQVEGDTVVDASEMAAPSSATPSTQTTATTAEMADTTSGSAAPSHATPAHEEKTEKGGALFKLVSNAKTPKNTLITYLRAHGTELNTPHSKTGKTPLMHAAERGNDLALNVLLARPDININYQNLKDGCTALHYALQGNKLLIISALLRKGAAHNLKDKAGFTARDRALNAPAEIRRLFEQHPPSSNAGGSHAPVKQNG